MTENHAEREKLKNALLLAAEEEVSEHRAALRAEGPHTFRPGFEKELLKKAQKKRSALPLPLLYAAAAFFLLLIAVPVRKYLFLSPNTEKNITASEEVCENAELSQTYDAEEEYFEEVSLYTQAQTPEDPDALPAGSPDLLSAVLEDGSLLLTLDRSPACEEPLYLVCEEDPQHILSEIPRGDCAVLSFPAADLAPGSYRVRTADRVLFCFSWPFGTGETDTADLTP